MNKKIQTLLLSFLMGFYGLVHAAPFEQVVIWGHKLHTHTHSYIHYGFFKAFQHLGYKTLWLDNSDDLSKIDFKATLFITEHQVDQKMPLRDDCYYFVHCSSDKKYDHLKKIKHFIDLDVYKNSHQQSPTLQEIEPFIFYDFEKMYFLIPWATDLLPEEIDQYKPLSLETYLHKRAIYWVGTIGGGIGGNDSELRPFMHACQQGQIRFIHSDPWSSPLDADKNIALIQNSFLAPAICGKLQLEKDYIPCRIFKNISYGHIGLTNSKVVYELFGRKIVYNPDTYQLFLDGEAKLRQENLQEQYELMDFVKKYHTYVNRAQHMISFVEQSQKYWKNLYHCQGLIP
jgi:hypothetical protein